MNLREASVGNYECSGADGRILTPPPHPRPIPSPHDGEVGRGLGRGDSKERDNSMERAPLPRPLPARASQGEGAGDFSDGGCIKMRPFMKRPAVAAMTGLLGWSTRTIPQGLVHRTARTSAGGQTNGLVEFAGAIRGWRSGTSSLARAIHFTMAGHFKLGPLYATTCRTGVRRDQDNTDVFASIGITKPGWSAPSPDLLRCLETQASRLLEILRMLWGGYAAAGATVGVPAFDASRSSLRCFKLLKNS